MGQPDDPRARIGQPAAEVDRVELCGPVFVQLAGTRRDEGLGRQARTLLVYLALRRGAVSRAELVEALWPGGPPPAARSWSTGCGSRGRRSPAPRCARAATSS